jgi:hypothetical protein
MRWRSPGNLSREVVMHRLTRRIGVIAGVAVFCLPIFASAEEPLVTDRPDFTESSSAVGAGVLQLESGITYADYRDGTDVTTVGEILARWGVLDKLELRFLLPTYARESGQGNTASGFLSTGVGLKYELAEGKGTGFLGGMEAALIAATSIPTGTADFASSDWQPSAVFCASWELVPTVGIGANLGVARPADDGTRFTSLWASAALGVGLTDATSMFFELFAFNREEDRGPSTVTFQTGLVYLFNSDLQADLRVARRLSHQGIDFLVGAGISWRLGG